VRQIERRIIRAGAETGRSGAGEDPLNASAASGSMRGMGSERSVRWAVRRVTETGSTNADLLADAQRGAPEGSALVAESQTAGRGRLGRHWVTPPGTALGVSVLFRPPVSARSRLGWLPLLPGLALLDAVRERIGESVPVRSRVPQGIRHTPGRDGAQLTRRESPIRPWHGRRISQRVRHHRGMGLPAKLLVPGEREVMSVRTHWKSLATPVVLLFAVTAFVSFCAALVPTGSYRHGVRVAIGVAGGLLLLRLSVWPFLQWLTTTHRVREGGHGPLDGHRHGRLPWCRSFGPPQLSQRGHRTRAADMPRGPLDGSNNPGPHSTHGAVKKSGQVRTTDHP